MAITLIDYSCFNGMRMHKHFRFCLSLSQAGLCAISGPQILTRPFILSPEKVTVLLLPSLQRLTKLWTGLAGLGRTCLWQNEEATGGAETNSCKRGRQQVRNHVEKQVSKWETLGSGLQWHVQYMQVTWFKESCKQCNLLRPTLVSHAEVSRLLLGLNLWSHCSEKSIKYSISVSRV